MKKKFFEPPTVTVIEVEVEQGFADSPQGNISFDVDDLTDGGTI